MEGERRRAKRTKKKRTKRIKKEKVPPPYTPEEEEEELKLWISRIFGLWWLHTVEWRISINRNANTSGAPSHRHSNKRYTMPLMRNSWRASSSITTLPTPSATMPPKRQKCKSFPQMSTTAVTARKRTMTDGYEPSFRTNIGRST